MKELTKKQKEEFEKTEKELNEMMEKINKIVKDSSLPIFVSVGVMFPNGVKTILETKGFHIPELIGSLQTTVIKLASKQADITKCEVESK